MKDYIKPKRRPSHPGFILLSGYIEQYELSFDDVANDLHISVDKLQRICDGKDKIYDISQRLEKLTGTPVSQWHALQENYDLTPSA